VLRAQETLAQPRMPVERAEKLKQLIEDKRKRSALSIPEPNLTGQSKYQFESDREDSEVENKINFEMDENLATSSVAEGAKALARTNDQDGEEQKRSVGRIAQKVCIALRLHP